MRILLLLLIVGLAVTVLPLRAQEDTVQVEQEKKVYNIIVPFLRITKNPDLNNARTKKELEYTSNIEESETTEEEDFLRIGGALRYNYIYTHYEGETFPLGAALRNDFTMDTWRLNVEGQNNGILLSFEYRFYPTFNTHFIQHGWLGYNFTDKDQLQLGVTQVPFGNLKYASHSWWFQTPYYVGLEDDYDMGLKWHRQMPNWDFHFAYFLLYEPRGTSEPSFGVLSAARYSYDVVPVPGESNLERNQFNIRAVRHIGDTRLGVSLQRTGIFNLETENVGNQFAGSLHLEGTYNRWNLNTEYIYYNYLNVENDLGEELKAVQMGAYGFGTYDVAAEASMYVIGLSYSIPVDWGPVSNITVYDDYTYTQKHNTLEINGRQFDFQQTQQNVLGALITAGSVYTYVDLAMGQNHPWITNDFGGTDLGIGNPEDFNEPISDTNPPDESPGWNTRFNINIGYYF